MTMTIKHSLYTQKYTSTIQKGPMWFFLVLGIALDVEQNVASFKDQRE